MSFIWKMLYFNGHRLQWKMKVWQQLACVSNIYQRIFTNAFHAHAHIQTPSTGFTFEHHPRLSDPSSLWSSLVSCQTGWASSGGSAALWPGSTRHHLLPHWQENTLDLLYCRSFDRTVWTHADGRKEEHCITFCMQLISFCSPSEDYRCTFGFRFDRIGLVRLSSNV